MLRKNEISERFLSEIHEHFFPSKVFFPFNDVEGKLVYQPKVYLLL